MLKMQAQMAKWAEGDVYAGILNDNKWVARD